MPLLTARPLTRAERLEFGRSHRKHLKRSEQQRCPENDTEAIEIVLASNQGRVPELVPVRMGRMARSPFAFYRGAAAVMATDLGQLPTSGLEAQLCGDAHASNLGAYAAPDGHLVFDINDFDETLRGPWEWDVKRLATSLVLAGRETGEREQHCCDAALVMTRSYRECMQRFSQMAMLELARYEVKRWLKESPVHSVLAQAERATIPNLLKKLTKLNDQKEDGWYEFQRKPPLLAPVGPKVKKKILEALTPYRQTIGAGRRIVLDAYVPVDIAFKVVGLGSVGLRDYVVLCYGNNRSDALFLQIKEERTSVLQPYAQKHRRDADLVHRAVDRGIGRMPPEPAGTASAPVVGIGDCAHNGRRVAEGQLQIQTASDPFLGWTSIDSGEYLVRQLNDHKASLEPDRMKGEVLQIYAALCGEVLAKAHARTGDAAEIYGYCGNSFRLDKAIAGFAAEYADRTTGYYEQFVKAVKAGKIPAETGI